MGVSRETFGDNSSSFLGVVGGDLSYRATLGQNEDLLPFFLSFSPGSFLLVDDSRFLSIFNTMFRSGLESFSVLTDFKIDSPPGFVSPLKRAVDNYVLTKNDPNRVVLINRSCFDGVYPYYFEGHVVEINSNITYDGLLNSIELSSLIRVSSVVGPGTYARRGSVLDVFPSELPSPVRVDFSYDKPKIFVFNSVSQLSEKEVDSFSLIVSDPEYKNIKTSELLGGLGRVSYFDDELISKKGTTSVDVSICSYDSYVNNKEPGLVSSSLHSVGVFVGGVLFVPSWFSGKRVSLSVPVVAPSFLDGFENLSLGDMLVHEDYGVCFFDGVVGGDDDEASVSLVFKDGKILLPASRVFVLSIYNGVGGRDRLGSLSKRGRWDQKKQSVSKKINVFVQQLLDQHLSRITSSIQRADLDLDLLDNFVSSFKYQDTLDQTSSFQEILEDMTSPEPMDRLLCGDVGFGKTEIAIRAAFLSILMGGPVIVLAPTTILCYQLLDSFKTRLAPFSVRVEMVSRLKSSSRVKKNIENFNLGSVDVLVCTHKVFSYIQSLKNVGLLVVDEEHRFGVKQKESFSEKFPMLDVLSMSATPIPRSLQGAFSGIKTMSIISTPPINRLPIQTTIDYFDVSVVANYINHEVSRSGQVYFLHNNVQSLNKVRRLLLDACPDVSFEVVHGQMSAQNIEKIISDFSSGLFQVLISTTIIENGLDISNVNTIIINNAHLFGLSQLHQIRGRVGRHSRQAFAYLLLPKNLKLNLDGKKRLKAIEENVSLGSGYTLSSKDLEIRGAGSLFGYNQSGGTQIGFDLYNKILNSSLSKLRGLSDFSINNIVVQFDSAGVTIPSSYIEEGGLRVSLYKTLFSISSLDELVVFEKNLINRFGRFPQGVRFLLWSQELRVLCFQSKVSSIVIKGDSVRIVFFPGDHIVNPVFFVDWTSRVVGSFTKDFSFKRGSGNRMVLCFVSSLNKKDIYVFLKDLLNKFRKEFLESK